MKTISHLHRMALLWLLCAAFTTPGLFAQAGLPTDNSTLFTGSGNCALCHNGNGDALTASDGTDLSIAENWRSTMMANAARDPYWQAKVESEVAINPQLQAVIEDKCTTCHAPMARTQAIHDGSTGYTLAEMRADPLAMDGVSCTACHQIQPDSLGSDDSFSGKYVIDDSRTIFGPYENVVDGLMQSVVNYRGVYGPHMQTSELCATCHTLFTPYLDDAGEIAGSFPEQTAYFEWQNSVYRQDGIECQDCHMPRIDEAVKISSIPSMLAPQSPFWRHLFVGGNAFMLEMLRDNGDEIGVTATEAQFDSTIALTRRQLRQKTARLSVETTVENDTLHIAATVENLAGHKFPTGFPSRRAWLHVEVSDEAGTLLFESGNFNDDGRIVALSQDYVPHLDRIDSDEQVQIWEPVMVDVNGEVTRTLLRGADYIKDNRIPPKGFVLNADRYQDMAIKGEAANDPNFNHDLNGEGSGSDVVNYFVDLAGHSGSLEVEVDLLYQSIKPAFVDDLIAHETPAITRFAGYYEDADKTPETIQSVETQVLVTEVAQSEPGLPRGFRLLQNYPNPFNAGTVISFALASGDDRFELTIYDIRGRKVRTLAAGMRTPGNYTENWDGTDAFGGPVSSGVYFYRLSAGATSLARKLIYVK